MPMSQARSQAFETRDLLEQHFTVRKIKDGFSIEQKG